MNSRPAATRDVEEAYRFVNDLVTSCQLYGVSSQSMVSNLERVVSGLGLRGEFVSTPNYVQTVLWREDEGEHRVSLSVSRSGNYNLSKLASVTQIADQVAAGTMDPADGVERLREIQSAPNPYGPALTALAFILSAASFALIQGGSWLDVGLGGAISLASYAVTVVAARFVEVAIIQEILAAMIVAMLASAAASIVPGTSATAVTGAAMVWFVPGFGFAMAPRELIVGNTLSGIIWFTNAAVTALKLFGGAALGFALVQGSWSYVAPSSVAGIFSSVWSWVAAPTLAIALAILFKVNWRDFPWIFLGSLLAWGATGLGEPLGFWQGTFLASAILVVYAKWYASKCRKHISVILLPCIMILLPGMSALRALYAASTQGFMAGLEGGYRVLLLIIAILGGVLIGEVLALLIPKIRKMVRTNGELQRD